jgi:hypothetical protein
MGSNTTSQSSMLVFKQKSWQSLGRERWYWGKGDGEDEEDSGGGGGGGQGGGGRGVASLC